MSRIVVVKPWWGRAIIVAAKFFGVEVPDRIRRAIITHSDLPIVE